MLRKPDQSSIHIIYNKATFWKTLENPAAWDESNFLEQKQTLLEQPFLSKYYLMEWTRTMQLSNNNLFRGKFRPWHTWNSIHSQIHCLLRLLPCLDSINFRQKRRRSNHGWKSRKCHFYCSIKLELQEFRENLLPRSSRYFSSIHAKGCRIRSKKFVSSSPTKTSVSRRGGSRQPICIRPCRFEHLQTRAR